MNVPAIFFCGDPHGQFDHLVEAVERHRPDALILLGDLEPQADLDRVLAPLQGRVTIRFIHGNHDTDQAEVAARVFDPRFDQLNLHGRVESICGVRIAGLGGVFRSEVWMPPQAPAYASYVDYERALKRSWHHKPPRNAIARRHSHLPGEDRKELSEPMRSSRLRRHRSSIFPETIEQLARRRADVLVTHEAPSCHPHGFEAIDELARALGVQTLFHGHHHDRLDYRAHAARLGFVAHGVGLRGVTDLHGGLVRAGEMDMQRMERGGRR